MPLCRRLSRTALLSFIGWGMEFDEIDLQVGYFKGMLEFTNGTALHFIEFVETYEEGAVKRLKYKLI